VNKTKVSGAYFKIVEEIGKYLGEKLQEIKKY